MREERRASHPTGAEQGAARGQLRWLFAGQGPMGGAALRALAARCPPAVVLTAEPPVGTWPVTAVAAAHHLELRHVERLGPDPARQWPELFARLDVAVCCCWGERLRERALQAPAHGWLNLHPSALPAWRGADPVAWQLLTAPARIGCSVHRMTEGQDDGPVVAEDAVAVGRGDDRGVLLERSGARLGELAAGVLAALARGAALRERVQRHDAATWCPPPGTVPLVDPRTTRAAAGARVARAFSPQPGIAVATLPPVQRFALSAVGRALTHRELPGSVARPDDTDEVAIAFADRWLRGRTWTLGSRA